MFEIDKSNSNPFAYATKEMVLNLRKIQCALLLLLSYLMSFFLAEQKLDYCSVDINYSY